jgi:predicted phosphodiesterase
MRVALVSDIHGNLTALEAVIADLRRRAPDLVLHGGDLALMGPRPAEVIDRIRDLGWPGVVGNTDELLWRPDEHARQLERAPRLASLLELIFDAYAPDTRDRLGQARLSWLRGLSAEHSGGELTVVHAQPGDLWRAPMPDASDDELSRIYRPLGSPRVAYGHIHRPFARTVDGLTVANSGSAGLPFDGDPRAAYLLLDDGVPTTIRVEYDIDREVRALHAAGHPDAERLAETRRTGRFVPPGAKPTSDDSAAGSPGVDRQLRGDG